MSSIPKEPIVDRKGMSALFGRWVLVGWEDAEASWGLVIAVDSYEMDVFLPNRTGVRGVEPYQIVRVGPLAISPE